MFNEIFQYNQDGTLTNKISGHTYHNKNREGYIRIRIFNKEFRAHRIIWEMFNGPIPEGMLVDHINGIKDDNRIENLRLATRTQNNINSIHKGAASGHKGITLNPSGKYRARISKGGVTYSLGTFKTIEEAIEAYRLKDVELNGEFAKT